MKKLVSIEHPIPRRLSRQLQVCIASAAFLLYLIIPSNASEFRRFNPIFTPEEAQSQESSSANIVNRELEASMEQVPQPSRSEIEFAVHTIARHWNSPSLDAYLAETFYDKDRLLQNINLANTEGAEFSELRVLSIQNASVLGRTPKTDNNGTLIAVENLVNAVVRFQVVLLDDVQGQIVKEGSSEFTIRLNQVRGR